jgi:hypothetical protein
MADLADDEDIKRTLKHVRYFRRDHNASAWQAEDDVNLNAFLLQVASELLTRILAGGEHVRPSFYRGGKSTECLIYDYDFRVHGSKS